MYVDSESRTRLQLNQVKKFSKDMIERLPNSFEELKIKNFNEVTKENKHQIIRNYLDDMNNTVFSNSIKKYFGKFYIRKPRYLNDAPYTLYRDLFEPVRQLYKDYLEKGNIKFKQRQ